MLAALSHPYIYGIHGLEEADITPDGTDIVFDRIRERSNLVLIDLAR